MRKIMFFDVDGTLMEDNAGHFVPESTKEALRLAHDAGHLLYVNTGRPLVNVDADVRELGFDGYLCGCGTYIECEREECFYQTVSPDVMAKMVQLVRDVDAAPLYEHRDGFFFDPTTRELPFIIDIRNTFRMQEKDVYRSADDTDFTFDKFVIAYDEKTDLEAFKAGIASYFAFVDRGWGFAEMHPLNCSKGLAMDFVMQRYGLQKSQSYAIGDSLNDLTMLRAAGTGIAMGDGEKLIPHADFVTAKLREDGIYKAMEHFGFFEKA